MTSSNTCELTDDDLIEDGGEDEEEEEEDLFEDLLWEECHTNGVNGWKCPSDAQVNCWYVPDTHTTCPEMVAIFEYYDMQTNCNMCPPEPIPDCAEQVDDVCNSCNDGYRLVENRCEVDIQCNWNKEVSPEGVCVSPINNCVPGQTSQVSSSTRRCLECNPGWYIKESNG